MASGPATTRASNPSNLPSAAGPGWPQRMRGWPQRMIVWLLGNRPPLLWPLLVVLAATPLLCYTGLDLAISGFFYDRGQQHWPLLDAQPWAAMADAACAPAIVLGVGGLVVLLLAICFRRLRPYGKAGLFLGLLLALGPGLLINGICKPCWGRPRPFQVSYFHGDRPFQPVWQPGTTPDSRSFPSGHASMGFYLMGPALLMYNRRRWALGFMALGLTSGTLIGLSRVMQGRHFASDILWSAAFVYFTAWALFHLLGLGKPTGQAADTPLSPAVPGRVRPPHGSRSSAADDESANPSRKAPWAA